MRLVYYAIVTMLVATTAALADASTQVDLQSTYSAILQPVLMTIATGLASVLVAAAGYAVAWLRKQTGIQALQLDQQHRDALDAALTNAAGLALNRLGNSLAGKTIDVKNPAVAAAVDYVARSAPDALEHFDLQGKVNALAEKVVAKLPQVANTTTTSSQ